MFIISFLRWNAIVFSIDKMEAESMYHLPRAYLLVQEQEGNILKYELGGQKFKIHGDCFELWEMFLPGQIEYMTCQKMSSEHIFRLKLVCRFSLFMCIYSHATLSHHCWIWEAILRWLLAYGINFSVSCSQDQHSCLLFIHNIN